MQDMDYCDNSISQHSSRMLTFQEDLDRWEKTDKTALSLSQMYFYQSKPIYKRKTNEPSDQIIIYVVLKGTTIQNVHS